MPRRYFQKAIELGGDHPDSVALASMGDIQKKKGEVCSLPCNHAEHSCPEFISSLDHLKKEQISFVFSFDPPMCVIFELCIAFLGGGR